MCQILDEELFEIPEKKAIGREREIKKREEENTKRDEKLKRPLDPAPMDGLDDAPIVENQKTKLKKKLDEFLSAEQHSLFNFRAFMYQLKIFARSKRVWVIIDEIVALYLGKERVDMFPLPEEQDKNKIHFIVTGSAGIGSWVVDRHLQKFVYDLPLFTKGEMLDYAKKTVEGLGHPIEHLSNYLCVTTDGIADCLEQYFGGVPGYISECLIGLAKKASFESFCKELSKRIENLFKKRYGERFPTFCLTWLNLFDTAQDPWSDIRNLGLCGSVAPRGAIFSMILTVLFHGAAIKNIDEELRLVRLFRSMFGADPGIDGLLLEFEVLTNLRKPCYCFEAALLQRNDSKWVASKECDLSLPPSDLSSLRYWRFDESIISSTMLTDQIDHAGNWHVIYLPTGFDVADVVMASYLDGVLTIYLVQITRSPDPFKNHRTYETCSERSQIRLKALAEVIKGRICGEDSVIVPIVRFVMLAPNCKKNAYAPPSKHSSPFYFSPRDKVKYSQDDAAVNRESKKRALESSSFGKDAETSDEVE